jgi:hypothetical protein
MRDAWSYCVLRIAYSERDRIGGVSGVWLVNHGQNLADGGLSENSRELARIPEKKVGQFSAILGCNLAILGWFLGSFRSGSNG